MGDIYAEDDVGIANLLINSEVWTFDAANIEPKNGGIVREGVMGPKGLMCKKVTINPSELVLVLRVPANRTYDEFVGLTGITVEVEEYNKRTIRMIDGYVEGEVEPDTEKSTVKIKLMSPKKLIITPRR